MVNVRFRVVTGKSALARQHLNSAVTPDLIRGPTSFAATAQDATLAKAVGPRVRPGVTDAMDRPSKGTHHAHDP
jgi:hypothetical protein